MKYPLIALALIAHTAIAEEHTVSEKPFHTKTTLSAAFLPSESTAIFIKPEAWSDFTITSLVPQGTVVKKGDTLIGIETKHIDKHIAEVEKSRVTAALALAQAKHELAQLEISTPRSLEAYARAEKEATENHTWYTKIGHPKEIEETKRSVERAEFRLEYQLEELKQLKKMYGEDSVTEETEEIILKRTKKAVESAEFALKSAKIDAKWALETAIPRKLESSKRSLKTAQINNASAKEKLPRELKQKRLAIAKAERDDEKKAENLAKLKADRAMMSITAPADGVVYYGSMKHGRWDPSSAVKVLKIGGKLPSTMPLMTFIPTGTPLILSAFAAENSLPNLTSGAKGHAITHQNRYQNIPVTITALASHPQIDGTYRVTLKPELPKNMNVVPGMKATVKVVGQKIDKALTIPSTFLTNQPDGTYTVKLKLADGKTEDRTVTIGASNKDSVVITKGLEKGQVIVK